MWTCHQPQALGARLLRIAGHRWKPVWDVQYVGSHRSFPRSQCSSGSEGCCKGTQTMLKIMASNASRAQPPSGRANDTESKCLVCMPQVILGDIPAALTTTRLADKLWGALLPRSLSALGLGLAAAAAAQAHVLPGGLVLYKRQAWGLCSQMALCPALNCTLTIYTLPVQEMYQCSSGSGPCSPSLAHWHAGPSSAVSMQCRSVLPYLVFQQCIPSTHALLLQHLHQWC